MFLAINLIALVLVLGLSWFAMVWMSGRFHGQKHDFSAGPFETDAESDLEQYELRVGARGSDCAACAGSGAQKAQGRLAPCPTCEGTGVRS